jgi:hypothetical protein
VLSLCIQCNTFSINAACLQFFNLPEFVTERLRNLKLETIQVFSDIRPCQLLIGYRRFEGFWCFRNVGNYLLNDMTFHPRRLERSATPLSEHHAASCYVFRDPTSGISELLLLCLWWYLVFYRTEWMAAEFDLVAEKHISNVFSKCAVGNLAYMCRSFIHSFSSLSHDRSKTYSKASSPHSAM